MAKKKLAIIGTNGVPAQYGGFETLAEQLIVNFQGRYEIDVYCSSKHQSYNSKEYLGANLKYLPLKANGWQSIFYDFVSTMIAFFRSDVLLVLGPACGFVFPFRYIFRKEIIVNHGGLNEWDRQTYNFIQKKYAWLNHFFAAKFSSSNIVDNAELKKSLQSHFNANSTVVRYGGDHVTVDPRRDYSDKYSFSKDEYFLCVARAQVDNNIHLLLEAFENLPDKKLVVVSNWDKSEYGIKLKQKYCSVRNVTLLDAIYDLNILNYIRENAYFYIHSHSQCGTAPSLVEAMMIGSAIISYDCDTNHETTNNNALFFSDKKTLVNIVKSTSQELRDKLSVKSKLISEQEYTWSKISSQYADLIDANLY